MNTTVFERGVTQGKQLGVEEGISTGEVLGQRNLLKKLLVGRFGRLPETVETAIDRFSVAEISALVEKVFDAESLTDLGFDESQP